MSTTTEYKSPFMTKHKAKKIAKVSLTYLFLVVVAIIVLYPIIVTVGAAFEPGRYLKPNFFPESPTLDNFSALFSDGSLSTTFFLIPITAPTYIVWVLNTLQIALITMVFSVFIITITAYVFSRFKFKGKKYALMGLMIIQMIPTLAAMVAYQILALQLGLYNNPLLVVFIYVGGSIPTNTFLMKGYFDTIPKELDEAARIDGARHFKVFRTIAVPLAKPMMAVIALWSFMGAFADYILPELILRDSSSHTVAVGLQSFIKGGVIDKNYNFSMFAAGAVLTAIPIVIAFMFLQKNFVSGLTSGGAKG